jgi:outer membrane protein insertion porin family
MKQSCMTGMLALVAFCSFSQAKILDTLVLEGLTSHQPAVVRNSIGLREKSEFSAADVQNAAKSLYRLGYFRSVDFFVTKETDSAASLLCKVTEYPSLESIEFAGNKKLKQKDFEEKLTMKKGMVLSDALLFDNVAIIKKQYAQKGYLLAEVTPELVPTQIPGNVLVKLKIDEGAKVVVRKIYFTGNTAFKEGKLKSNFKTKEKKFLWGGDFDRDLYQGHMDSLVLFYNDQ